jgi:hypothetical protein
LKALGRAFDHCIRDDRAALSTGVLQFKVDFTQFREWYKREHWLRRNSTVAVSAGADGLSGFRRDGAWAAHRDEITRFSHILFSGRPGEREFWLAKGSPEDRETVMRLGGPKPCVHGSDAHPLAKLFLPDDDRFCWIKADPTFEGLKQLLYEPADRVHMGPSAPIYHDEARVIRSVKVSNAGGWFDEISIPLNAGLVSIIGQKGSGKSALAELIAFAAGSWEEDSAGAFLKRAGDHLQNLSVELEWADRRRSSVRLGNGQPDTNDVRYLSQKFVERLCAEDEVGAELIHEIESVVFSFIDPTDTLNASSFEELRAIRTEQIRAEGDRLRMYIQQLIREDCELRDTIGKVPDKKARIKTLEKEREGLVKQIPPPASAAEARLHKELQEKRDALTAAQQAAAADKQTLQKISDIRSRIAAFKAQMGRFYSEIEGLLIHAGIPDPERQYFRPEFTTDTEPLLARREAEVRASLTHRDGAMDNPAEGTIRWLQNALEVLVKQESADKARQERIKVIQTRIAAINTEIERIQSEISRIEGPGRQRLMATIQERRAAYIQFFQNLKEEQQTLEELYAPVKGRISSSEREQDLEFSIRWEADMQQWLERGGTLFDQRKTIPYGTMERLNAAARHILAPAWTSGDPESIGKALEQFIIEFNRPGSLSPRDYMRSGVSVQDVLLWLFEVDHIRLNYGLKYNIMD